MENNYNNIPVEKFQFATRNDLLHDSKFETKPVSYFQGAFKRFSKNKGAVVGGIVITVLVLFAINGVGGLYLNSITFQDYDFFMLLSGFYTLIGLTAGIVIDISYGFIDPRIRMGAK